MPMKQTTKKYEKAETGLERVAYLARFPEEQHKELKRRAKKNGHSIQAELDDILKGVLGVL